MSGLIGGEMERKLERWLHSPENLNITVVYTELLILCIRNTNINQITSINFNLAITTLTPPFPMLTPPFPIPTPPLETSFRRLPLVTRLLI